ncbi:MgtC family membrane protein [Paenibacillus faecis]|nr:MgtC family membrane protein [Paenibacillus faecis]
MASPWHIGTPELIMRLLLSLFLGGIVGYEREVNRHAAGLRTNILVCVGSTLIMLLSIYGFTDFLNEPTVRTDPARLAAQVISGIGFLGAGTIMQKGASIKGLTTAATLWVMAAIGLAVGAGFYYPAAITCLIVIISLKALNKVEHRFLASGKIHTLKISLPPESPSLAEMYAVMTSYHLDIKTISIANENGNFGSEIQRIKISFAAPKNTSLIAVLEKFHALPDVSSLQVES